MPQLARKFNAELTFDYGTVNLDDRVTRTRPRCHSTQEMGARLRGQGRFPSSPGDSPGFAQRGQRMRTGFKFNSGRIRTCLGRIGSLSGASRSCAFTKLAHGTEQLAVLRVIRVAGRPTEGSSFPKPDLADAPRTVGPLRRTCLGSAATGSAPRAAMWLHAAEQRDEFDQLAFISRSTGAWPNMPACHATRIRSGAPSPAPSPLRGPPARRCGGLPRTPERR